MYISTQIYITVYMDINNHEDYNKDSSFRDNNKSFIFKMILYRGDFETLVGMPDHR